MPSPCVGRPFGLMANATGEMPFASQPVPWQLTTENPRAQIPARTLAGSRRKQKSPLAAPAGLR